MTDYQFNKHNVHHLFCSTCGISSYGWGTGKNGQKMFSINARCLDEVDLRLSKRPRSTGRNSSNESMLRSGDGGAYLDG